MISRTILEEVAPPTAPEAALWKRVLAACVCVVCLTTTRFAAADYIGIVAESKDDLTICQDDPDEPNIPYPLRVCNVYAAFDNPLDWVVGVGKAIISTSDPNGYFQHPFQPFSTSPKLRPDTQFSGTGLRQLCDHWREVQ